MRNQLLHAQGLTYNVWLGGIHCTCGVFRWRHLQGRVGVEAGTPQPLQRSWGEKWGSGRGCPCKFWVPLLGLIRVTQALLPASIQFSILAASIQHAHTVGMLEPAHLR